MKIKKLVLLTVLLFIFTILLIIIGLILIGFFNIKNSVNYMPCFYNHYRKQEIITQENGFDLIKEYDLSYILNNNKLHFCKHSLLQYSIENYNLKSLLQLQIGITFCLILVPVLAFIILSLTFFIIGLKIKIKNNNFWDAIQNCEIINNYYIH